MGFWDEMLISHCERTTSGFMAEPFNAFSTLGFLLASVLLMRIYIRQGRHLLAADWDILLLTGLVFMIGVSSFLLHTIALSWTRFLDMVLIIIFMNMYLISFLRRIIHVRGWRMLGWLLLFFSVILCTLFSMSLDFLNGTLLYFPAWMTLFLMALYLVSGAHASGRFFVVALVAFSISIVLHTIDAAVCWYFPSGTHFFWHLLGAYIAYQLIVALMMPSSPSQGRKNSVLGSVRW